MSGYLKIAILPVLAVFIAIVLLAPQDAHAATITAAPGGGNWNVPGTWSPVGVPSSGDTVIIPATVTVTIPAGLTVTITGTVTNNGILNIIATGGIINQGTIFNAASATINNQGTVTNTNAGTISNRGTINNLGPSGKITNAGTINNIGGAINNNGGSITNTAHINNPNGLIINTNSGSIINNGHINNPKTNGVQSQDPCASVTGSGTISPQPVFPLTCKPSIPEFPIPFSMIIIFVAVAAVYMGIRQKMIPGFKI